MGAAGLFVIGLIGSALSVDSDTSQTQPMQATSEAPAQKTRSAASPAQTEEQVAAGQEPDDVEISNLLISLTIEP